MLQSDPEKAEKRGDHSRDTQKQSTENTRAAVVKLAKGRCQDGGSTEKAQPKNDVQDCGSGQPSKRKGKERAVDPKGGEQKLTIAGMQTRSDSRRGSCSGPHAPKDKSAPTSEDRVGGKALTPFVHPTPKPEMHSLGTESITSKSMDRSKETTKSAAKTSNAGPSGSTPPGDTIGSDTEDETDTTLCSAVSAA